MVEKVIVLVNVCVNKSIDSRAGTQHLLRRPSLPKSASDDGFRLSRMPGEHACEAFFDLLIGTVHATSAECIGRRKLRAFRVERRRQHTDLPQVRGQKTSSKEATFHPIEENYLKLSLRPIAG
jgi:hypothetical protein